VARGFAESGLSNDTMPLMDLSDVLRAMDEFRVQDLSAEQKCEVKTAVTVLGRNLETPWDTTKRIVWQEVSEHALTR
jgi:hypothetical protein